MSLLRSFSSLPVSSSTTIRRAAQVLSKAKSLLIVTGAGISAESGLPTYRGISGLYQDSKKAEEENDGMTIEQCLSASTYRRTPQLTWKHLLRIEKACRGATPSVAHYLLAAMEKYMNPVTIMTQNIDGLHTRAGSTDVLCLHGELYTLICTDLCQLSFPVQDYALIERNGTFPPPCPNCGGAIRPNVVLFDEYLGDETIATYEDRLGESMASLMWNRQPAVYRYDVSISIGTSALFPYVNAAALAGKFTMEINPVETPLRNRVDCYIQGGATATLKAIFQELGWEA